MYLKRMDSSEVKHGETSVHTRPPPQSHAHFMDLVKGMHKEINWILP
jgi:hypothetical protein